MGRAGPVRRDREKQLFTKICGCINHNTYTDSGTLSFKFRDRSYFSSRQTFSELLRLGLVEQSTTTICTRCLDFARKKINERESRNKERLLAASSNPNSAVTTESLSPLQTNDTTAPLEPATSLSNLAGNDQTQVDTVSVNPAGVLDVEMPSADNHTQKNNLLERIEALEMKLQKLNWKDLDIKFQNSLSSLACTLGKIIRKDIDSEKWIMAKECTNLESLISIDRRKWFLERNLLLPRFLEGCSGVSHSTAKDKKFNSAVHCVEQVMYLQNNNMVTPFSFQRNIISYMTTKSRTASAIMGAWESSGSYTKVIEVLNSPAPPL